MESKVSDSSHLWIRKPFSWLFVSVWGRLFRTVFDSLKYIFWPLHKLNAPFAVMFRREKLNICINYAEFSELEWSVSCVFWDQQDWDLIALHGNLTFCLLGGGWPFAPLLVYKSQTKREPCFSFNQGTQRIKLSICWKDWDSYWLIFSANIVAHDLTIKRFNWDLSTSLQNTHIY